MPGIQPNDISTNWQLSCCWWLNCFFFFLLVNMSVAFPADKRRRRRRGIFIFQAAIVCETRVPVSSGYIKHDSAAGIYFMQIAGAHTPLPISFYPRATVRTRIFFPPSAVAVSFWFFLSYVQDRVTPIYPPIFPSRFPTFLFGRVSMSRNLIRTTILTAKPQSRKIYRRGTSIAPNSFVINAYKYTGGESSTW